MTPDPWNQTRRVVPRWRPLTTTLRAGDLAPLQRKPDFAEDHSLPRDLVRRLEKWRMNPSVETAGELLETAVVEGREREAVRAARALMNVQWKATPSLKAQAARVLERTGAQRPWIPEHHSTQEGIRRWRSRVREYPGDALAWLELAFHRTIAGHNDEARIAMAAALRYAPHNRHVLRSASRFYLHVGDFDYAHSVLARNECTKSDPWLIAAEISLADIVNKQSRLIKTGQRMIAEERYLPKHTSELAAAIGTLELFAGNRRAARKTLQHSLVAPTGNSLAQLEWISSGIREDLVPEARILGSFERSEALAFHRLQERRLEEIPLLCEIWALEEPYSIRPYEFGAAAAGVAGDHSKACELARMGLKMRPGAAKLSNALAFSSASIGLTGEARAALAQMSPSDETDSTRLVSQANRGLIAFREGDLDEGLARYQSAIDGFKSLRDRRSEASARCYLAREALRANLPNAEDLRSSAVDAWKSVDPLPHPALPIAVGADNLEAEQPLLQLGTAMTWRLN